MYLLAQHTVGSPKITLNMGLFKGDVDKMEGLMSEKTFALPLLEPCQMNPDNTIEPPPLIDLLTINTQLNPNEQFKAHDPDEAIIKQASYW